MTGRKLILLALVLLLIQSAKAQKKWTLEQCIEYALQHNIEIKQKELSLKIQESSVRQSKASLLPTITANGSDVINWGKSVDRYTNQFADTRTNSVNLYLQGNVTLFNGFQMLNNVKRNIDNLKVQEYQLELSKDLKSLSVTTAFLQIVYDKETLINKENQVKLSQKQTDRTQKLVDAGSRAKGDLFNINSQLASDQVQYIKAENQLNLSTLRLKQLMDLPGDTTLEIETPVIELTENFGGLQDPYAVYDYAIQNRPEIKGAEMQVETSKKSLSISKGGISPSLSFSASLGSGFSGANQILDGTPVFNGYNPTGDITTSGDKVLSPNFTYNYATKQWSDQIVDNRNYSIGFHLRIPIFNGLQTHTNISQSKIAVQQAELQLEQSKRDMRQTIEQAYADARSSFKQYEAAKIQVESLQEAFTYSEEKFNAGMIDAFEYNSAKIKLDLAMSQLLTAKFDYVFRVKVLDFYYGKPLTL
ncbi:MAG: TolC family protein [Bacteroidales bacterium]|nr:TolC family protein [Bacteroidales bacterium]